ncbi:MAG TPA: cysteine hydrolase [Rhodocyclaceae bacterium]|nr:MAG: cysteine hydrolase [Betaproteobacteria bacterium CG2_30_68_42]PIV71597.1 MAG: cysteine hydrolase [Rhodocyclales bacterium CG17_big_fil_post_rev_8_21_14_2_50_68_7]PIX76117.1 MAG: cysteine hydrolase [Rhodocyclales bacterium CG_4_10_14_3_um_filter_68_10]PJA58106.1 MAG: cysteine hydrolase [Rhodocyclales bacterium CG_4_9_14_3_um_filter_68_10]HCX33365.1 cysteine hydrolase [Rhodocyclaceae bacterium]
MDNALLIVDIQNDYFPGGAMALEGAAEAAAAAARLLAGFRARGASVLHVRHLSLRPGAAFFLPGTFGAEIHESVRPSTGEPVFEKHFPNSFRETGLLDHLKANGIARLVVAGMMTHLCIDTTVRAAFDLGYACTLAHDACATRALAFGGAQIAARDVQLAFVAALDGLFARVRTAEAILAGS